MSEKYPIVAITGSSGSGTTTVRNAFNYIFRREGILPAYVDGDSFQRYERNEMSRIIEESNKAGKPISHFGPEANRFDLLEDLFREYSESGTGRFQKYVKEDDPESASHAPGTFAEACEIESNSDLILYEGLHGGVVASSWTRRRMSESHNPVVRERRNRANNDSGIDIAQYVDFLIGIVPVMNLEWIQKIHRDRETRGRPAEQTTTTILRRLQEYIHFMAPQFSVTDINFQRVPLVDTSNPFISRDVPTASESMLVIRFREPGKFNICEILERFEKGFMSRPNTMVVPGGQLQMALDVICTPKIRELVKNARRSRGVS